MSQDRKVHFRFSLCSLNSSMRLALHEVPGKAPPRSLSRPGRADGPMDK